jgi:hypothetical protein
MTGQDRQESRLKGVFLFIWMHFRGGREFAYQIVQNINYTILTIAFELVLITVFGVSELTYFPEKYSSLKIFVSDFKTQYNLFSNNLKT